MAANYLKSTLFLKEIFSHGISSYRESVEAEDGSRYWCLEC